MPRKPRARRTTSSKSKYPSDPITAYARDLVDGRIIAGELQRYAGERHLRDIVDGEARGLFWRPEVRALNETGPLAFLPAVLSITAGPKAGQPFNPLPWHRFFVGSLFGWLTASGRLRFTTAWAETGKGQAKSPLFGGISLYLMGWYGVPRAECYSIGQDKATANVLFKDAVAMCRANIPGAEEGETDSLESRGEVLIRGEGDNAWKIEHPETGSKFQALANNESVSGPRPVCVSADEIHEFKNNYAIETWKRALAKMSGDRLMLMGTNTPASTQLVGTEYSEFFQAIAKGEVKDDEAFSFIARVDKADRETVFDNEACWQKALPALGITFPMENIRGEVNTAKQLSSTAISVKRLYFGIPTGVAGFWMEDEQAWMDVQGRVDPEKLKGRKCWLSLDLSKKNDLTALSAAWEADPKCEDEDLAKVQVKTWYWTTKKGLADRARRDLASYVEWADNPAIDFTAVDGSTIDKTFAAQQVANVVAEHDVQFLAFDVAGMADFMKACEDIGFPVWLYEGPGKLEGAGLKLVRHNQGKRRVFEEKQLTMPTSIEKFEDLILEHSIVIDASPVNTMCAGNAIIETDGQGNRCFDKARSRGRIDGLVTKAMAVGAVFMNEDQGPDYDEWLKDAKAALAAGR